MPIEIVRNDITHMHVDAIVNAANESLLGGSGVDGAIHRAAGPGLLEECRRIGGCPTGEARLTRGYRLPCRYVIHTVGPIWRGGTQGEEALLRACYRNSLALARAHRCESIAFPLISAGAYGYPREQALSIAMDCARDFLLNSDMKIYIVIFDRDTFRMTGRLYAGIAQYIDDVYVSEQTSRLPARNRFLPHRAPWAGVDAPAHDDAPRPGHTPHPGDAPVPEDATFTSFDAPAPDDVPFSGFSAPPLAAAPRPSIKERIRDAFQSRSLTDVLGQMDETFSHMLLRKIDERGITDATCYKRANIDRKLFSKIRSDAQYHPSKRTALALAIALELSLEDTRQLLATAGLALSHSIKSDIIVEYCIMNQIYDIDEINCMLFAFDQNPLGS